MDRLDKNCRLPVGTRDALHVPFVVARCAELPLEQKRHMGFVVKPGTFVKFTDEAFTRFAPCEKNEAHGVLNPFIDEVGLYDNVVIFILPGITSPVRHQFEIDPSIKTREKELLEFDLNSSREEDPDCADCYQIRNNEIIRN